MDSSNDARYALLLKARKDLDKTIHNIELSRSLSVKMVKTEDQMLLLLFEVNSLLRELIQEVSY